MPLTSLASQLKRLSVPQTSQLVDKKSKASLLFEPGEAANIDRDTFHSIGLSGLEKLIEINPVFDRYDKSLFDVASISFVRAVETAQKNEKVDREVSRFLIHASPYFLLKPTHKALEWLIQRFQIHDYNTDELMMLTLPYCETNFFPQVVRLLNLKKRSFWKWLAPIQKQGTPLSKTALLNRAATDISFFKFVCNMPLLATEVYKNESGACLTTLFAFYCTTVIGAFEHADVISELHISYLLPTLTLGLSSCVNDFIAASYMILSFLATKIQIGDQIVQSLFTKIMRVKSIEMRPNAALLMIILSQKTKCVTEKSLSKLIKQNSWFFNMLVELSDSDVVVYPLISDILSCCMKTIVDQTNLAEKSRLFIDNIIKSIKLNEENITHTIQIFVGSCKKLKNNGNEEDMIWFGKVLHSLEKQYPKAFDSILSDSKYCEVAKEILGFAPEYKGQDDLFEKLHHPNPKVRVQAIQVISERLEPIQTTWLSDTIFERLSDEDPAVVKAIIDHPAAYLKSLLGEEKLFKSLLSLADKIWTKDNDGAWSRLAPTLFRKLSVVIPSDFDELTILMSVVPFLLIAKEDHLEIAKVILSSLLIKTSKFLKSISKDLDVEKLSETSLMENIWRSLENMDSLQLNINENFIKSYSTATSIKKFLVVLFCTHSVARSIDPEESAVLIDCIYDILKGSKITYKRDKEVNMATLSDVTSVCLKEKLPLQVVQSFLCSLISKTAIEFSHVNNCWWSMQEPSQKFLNNVLKMSFTLSSVVTGIKEKHFINFRKRIVLALQKNENLNKWDVYYKLLCNAIVTNPNIALNWFNELNTLFTFLQENNANWTTEVDILHYILPTVLVGLSCSDKAIRTLDLEIINSMVRWLESKPTQFPVSTFLKELIQWEDEIVADEDQAAVAIYMLLCPDSAVQSRFSENVQKDLSAVSDGLYSVASDVNTPPRVVALLLHLLSHVTSLDIMKRLIPMANNILDLEEINENHNKIVQNVINRIDASIVSIFDDEATWLLAEKSLKAHNKQIVVGGETPAVLFLRKISHDLFDELSEVGKQKLINLVVTVNADSEDGDANVAVTSMVKRVTLDASSVQSILCGMRVVKVPPPEGVNPKKKWLQIPIWTLLKTIEWRKGISLLELIQNKKKLNNVQHLLPLLFDVLKRCLEFEEQSPVEYVKQLLLSTILHVCQKLSEEGKLSEVPKHVIQVELIVQCIRGSQNPQTHHHALLVLVEVAALVPDKVLHDVMPIFTFVGSSVLRMDDAYSFQIIIKIIETVIPILVQNIKNKEDIVAVQQVLQVFVDALLDIPEHRRLTLLVTLITTLDREGGYLWLLICLVAQSEVLSNNTSNTKSGGLSKKDEKMKILKNLCLEFPAVTIINTMYEIMNHIVLLPHDKDVKGGYKKFKERTTESSVFDVDKNTGKQLRHYKFIIISFISMFFSTPKFIDMLLTKNDNINDETLVRNFNLLVNAILDYLDSITAQVNETSNEPSSKYWKVMKSLVEDINGKVNAVLPNTVFLKMMKSILSANCPPKKQRKMMEILSWRLQSTILDDDGLVSLVPTILKILRNCDSSNSDTLITKQASFIVLKLLARQIASSHPAEFETALSCVTDLVKEGLGSDFTESNSVVLASAVLCLAELVAALGFKAIQFIPKFMPPIIRTVAKIRENTETPDVLLLSVVTTIQKVLEYHTDFLNPYLDRLLTELCLISATLFDEDNPHKSSVTINKLNTIRKNLAETLDLRVLLPAVESSYTHLLEKTQYKAVTYLFSLLGESLNKTHIMRPLYTFLITCLDFRYEICNRTAVGIVEPAIISCVMSMILKMNEKDFKSFFAALNCWAVIPLAKSIKLRTKQRTLTFYNVCRSLAETLKSIFVPFTKEFLPTVGKLLNAVNTEKSTKGRLFFSNTSKQKGNETSEDKEAFTDTKELLQEILQVLLTVFKCDNEHFITEDRFNMIMQPLVDTLENKICLENDMVDNLLVPCIAHMTTSISDDTLWKKLNYEILLKMQNDNIQARLAALKVICGVAKELGDSYLPLLPETIPFLAELLEDEDEVVEKSCRSAIQSLESILGEEISKYF